MTRKQRASRLFHRCIEKLEQRRLLTTYYVDNAAADHGSDSNVGTSLSAPFLTIQKAASLAQTGDTVDILAGTYRETVSPANSGTASAPITYQPYNSQKVTISGADVVNSGWTQYSGSIYQTSNMSWTMGGQDDQLFVDGQMINFARWPNTSLDVSHPAVESAGPNTTGVQNSNGTLTETIYDANLTQPAGYWNGATIHVQTGAIWVYEAATITNYTRSVVNGVSYGVITYTSSFTDPNYNLVSAGDPFYITGDPYFTAGGFQTLNASGQFYRDPNTGKLYLWTPTGDSPANHLIEAKHREWAFDLSGDSYINVNGINISAASINTTATSNHIVINGINAQYVSHFENYYGSWIPYELNNNAAIGSTGIILDGNYDALENSTIAYSAGDGVFLGGNNETVYNNTIHDVDYLGLTCAGIDEIQFQGPTTSNDTISYNTVYNSGRADISVSGLSNSQVDNNVVYSPMLQTTDGAAIYGYYGNGNGTEIDRNIVYNTYESFDDFTVCGIFLDQNSTGYTIDHNLIYSVGHGIKLFETNSNNVLNNTIVNTSVSLDLYGAPTGTIANNIITNATAVSIWSSQAITNGIAPATDPKFVSPSTNNYQLQSSSPAINAGIVVVPYTNGFVGSAPDIGAFEYGATAWTAGSSSAAAAVAATALPVGWNSADIGAPAIPGSSYYSGGVFTVEGSGNDIWGSSDQFQFVDTSETGNQTIIARVSGQSTSSGWAKAGVMFRASGAANSAFVSLVTTPSNGVNLLSRDPSGNLAITQSAAINYPVWLKLVRTGNAFTAFDSVDGVNWTSVGSISITLPSSALVGLAVTSQNVSLPSTATFDNVSFIPLAAPTGVTATSVSSSSVQLNWTGSITATGYQIQRSSDGTNYSTIASVGNVSSYLDSSASGSTQYYRIVATNSAGSSSPSAVATVTKPAVAPASLAIADSPVGITLIWNAAPGASSYDIYRGVTGGGEGSSPIATGVTALTYLDTQLLTGNKYYYYVTAVSQINGASYQSAGSPEVFSIAGVVSAVPAVIQAENYDLGGQGAAYNSVYSTNISGAYRNDGVAVEVTSDTGGGYDVGTALPGEWLNYTVNVASTGYYTFNPRVASAVGGGVFHINIDGTNVSGPLTIPNTAGWQTWTTLATSPVQLTAGTHVMRIALDSATNTYVGNFNYVTVSAVSSPTLPVPTGVQITDSPVGVTLSWTATTGATGYNIYRGTTSGGEGASPIATGITSVSYLDTKLLTGTQYYYYVTALSSGTGGTTNESKASAEVSTIAGVVSTAPGVIQAANYDLGGQGVAYNTTSTVNLGGQYRNDGISIEGAASAGYDVGWTFAGEWLNYTTSFPTTGYYTFAIQIASPNTGGAVHLSIDGTNTSGEMTVPNTGAWTTYTSITTSPVQVTAGTHVMRLTFDLPTTNNNVCNVRTITINSANPASTPTGVQITDSPVGVTLSWNASTGAAGYNIYRGTTSGGESATPIASGITALSYLDTQLVTGAKYYYYVTAVSPSAGGSSLQSAASTEVATIAGLVSVVPGVIQAANYDLGGEGVGYHTLSAVNLGGAYRNDGVSIEGSASAGYDVGWTVAGEWLDYTISVPTTGSYSFAMQVATPNSGVSLHVNVDGTNISGEMAVPNTGAWQTYTTITTAAVQVTTGTHVIRVAFDTPTNGNNACNLKTITVAAAAAAVPAVPTGVTATGAAGGIRLAWTAGSNDATYNVYRSTTSAGEGTTPYATGITATSFTDTQVTLGQTYYYTLAGTNGTNTSAGSAEVSAYALAAAVADGSFESTSVNGSYTYDPTTANWKFTGNAGIEANGSTWNASNAADGKQAAFLQSLNASSGGSISQAINFLAPGKYQITFSAAQRASYGVEPIAISVDGSVVTTITPGSTAFQSYSTTPISLTAGAHVLAFATAPTSSADAASFIDKVAVTTVAIATNPPAGVSATPGAGQIVLSWNAPAGAVSYNVYRGTAAGGEGATPLVNGITTTSYVDSAVTSGTTYYYFVTAVDGTVAPLNSESLPSSEVSATLSAVKITGTPIGTATSYANSGDTIAQVFDGNFNTFYDAQDGTLAQWVGLDMGFARTITQIRYAPRPGYEWRMVGGQFQASNTADFSAGVVNLFTITTAPLAGQFTTVPVSPGAAYRYVRYVGGTGWVNIAEMEVDGLPASTPVYTKLTGAAIGTQTSYLNNGDTIAQVFDGNFNTYFDAPNSSLTNWVGLDLGVAQQIAVIKYAPRAGYEWRMVGGQFQVSSTPDFSSNVQTLYTITTAPVAGQFTTINVSPNAAYRYVRFVGGTSWVNIAEMEVDGMYTAPPVSAQLTGSVIGTPTSYLNNGDTIAQVFDGNLNTYYDAADNNLSDWAGLDLGTARTITQISYAPRAGNEFRMVGGQFQVSNTANFSSGVVTLYTITSAPTAGGLTTVSVSAPGTYRYVRYVGGTQWVNIAEMQVFGY